jgi:hypothetical protein
MTNPANPTEQKTMTPDLLANQLLDGFLFQFKSPQEALKHVVIFLSEAIVYTISSTAGNEPTRQERLKEVGDVIANAPCPPMIKLAPTK